MIATIDKSFDDTIQSIKRFDSTQFDHELDHSRLNRTKRQILISLADRITLHIGHMLIYKAERTGSYSICLVSISQPHAIMECCMASNNDKTQIRSNEVIIYSQGKIKENFIQS
jgi:hypothetical protein